MRYRAEFARQLKLDCLLITIDASGPLRCINAVLLIFRTNTIERWRTLYIVTDREMARSVISAKKVLIETSARAVPK